MISSCIFRFEEIFVSETCPFVEWQRLHFIYPGGAQLTPELKRPLKGKISSSLDRYYIVARIGSYVPLRVALMKYIIILVSFSGAISTSDTILTRILEGCDWLNWWNNERHIRWSQWLEQPPDGQWNHSFGLGANYCLTTLASGSSIYYVNGELDGVFGDLCTCRLCQTAIENTPFQCKRYVWSV